MLRFQSLGARRLLTSHKLLRLGFTTKQFTSSYSSDIPVTDQTNAPKPNDETTKQPVNISTNANVDSALPWYLQMTQLKEERELTYANQQVTIDFPPNSPDTLVQMCNFLAKEQGMKDILIFDMRKQDVLASKMADFMVIATAKSIKHCQGTFLELNKMIKRDFNHFAYLEGNINQNEERKRKKRMQRKTNLGGVWNVNKRNLNTHDTNEAWYMIDTRTDNIFVNILTDQRRAELNLEELYASENDKAKWTRQSTPMQTTHHPDDLLDVNDENNVLAGLRRLAEQRRQYSTSVRQISSATESANSSQMRELLQNNDFDGFQTLVSKNISNLKGKESLEVLKIVDSALVKSLSQDTSSPVNIESWVKAFDIAWPLHIPANSPEFWEIRYRFLKSLACSQHNVVGLRLFTEEYFKTKMYHNVDITMGEINSFLSLALSQLKGVDSKRAATKTLKNQNKTIANFLDLFIGHKLEAQILRNPKTVDLLLKTMIYDKEIRLTSMQRTISHLSSIPQLPEPAIISIINILSSNCLWPELFKFWKERSERIVDGNDKRPWLQFIQAVAKCDDQNILTKFIEDGNLLWLLRYGVFITPNMGNALTELFTKADPKNITFKYQRSQFNL